LSAAHFPEHLLQLVGTQDQAAQPADFEQHGDDIGIFPAAQLDFVEVGFGEFGAVHG
jgi:hypothetical protein